MIERVAFGLYALEVPLNVSPEHTWSGLPALRRDLYLARARFVLSYAEDLFIALEPFEDVEQ